MLLRLAGAALAVFPLFTPSCVAQTVPNGFSDAVVVSGFNAPVGFTFDANGRMYVWEKSGKVWIVDNGTRYPNPLIDLSEEVGDWRDHGCLGFALDPAFLTNGRIYLFYAVDRNYLMNFGQPGYDPAADLYFSASIMRLTRYTAIGPAFTTVNPSSRTVLLGETKKKGVPLLFESHSTGSLVFASDGTLMLSTGDGASYNSTDVGGDPQTYFSQALADSIITPAENVGAMRSQMLSSMNGKLLRIDPETGNGVPSNPFYDPAAPRSAQSRVWALGLRNPYRFTRRPGTGSTDPADGDPGVFYIGDVGWSIYEELNVCYTGGMNFGWPVFEGMEENGSYLYARTPNSEAPNPLYGQGLCTQRYFDFQDLLKQETLVHPTGLPNPCDPGTLIPPNIHTFTNDRPMIDWVHGNQSRCSAFNGNMAVQYDLDDPNSPVPGPRFGGNASVGGSFITGTGWPAGYQGSYFQGDYAGAWIRRVNVTADNKAVQVFDFGSNLGAVVFLKEGPDGALWYVRYETGQIRKISPLGVTNLPPVAVAEQNVLFGPGPLTVNFTGVNSTDPENGPLTYLWAFGDGGTSTMAAPSHVFNAAAGVPTTFTVTLTVRDDHNQPNSATLLVNVNNTPPVVAITSFPDGQSYPVGVDTTVILAASVTDAEHGPSQLTYSWQTIFHHNTHVHSEPLNHAFTTATVLSGLGCYEENYYYEVRLTVTDAGGLSSTVSHFLYPRCSSIAPTAVITAPLTYGTSPFLATMSGSSSVDNGTIVDYGWDFGDGTTANGVSVNKTFTETGDYLVTLRVTDNDGLIASTVKVFSVYTLDPPQCVGAVGSILREYWSNITGTTISSLINSPGYPDTPSGTSYPTSIRGPVNFANNYGTRMRGYIIAPSTGIYTFNTTSDDASAFYLSLNADPALKQMICYVPGFSSDTQFDKYSGQQSGNITLVAGKYYYFECLHKEGSGGDHMTVRWTRPGDAALTVVDGAYLARWEDCPPSLKLRMALTGPYDESTGMMEDNLRAMGIIPLHEPYTALGFTQVGGGGEAASQAMLNVTGKNAVVDWVLVELRNKANPSVIMATQAALLQRDGDVVGTDGYSRLIFNVPSDQYYVAVRHRNHLGIMALPQQLLNKNLTTVDFTDPALSTYGAEARRTFPNGRMGCWAGNSVNDGRLKYTGSNNDRDPMLVAVGLSVPTQTVSGYAVEDVNMDGFVRYTGSGNDRDGLLISVGGNIPSAVRVEQMP